MASIAAYQSTNRSSVIANICLSGMLLPTTLAIAFFTFRRARKLHLRVSWHIVSFATACLLGFQATVLAWSVASLPLITSSGPYPDSVGRAQRVILPIMALCSGFYSLSIFIACRAAFWEITAHRVFRRHDTGRWILLAFDLLIILVVLGFFLASVVQSILTYRRYSDAFVGYDAIDLIDNILTTFVWVSQSLLAAGYINGAVGTYFARRWARQYQFGVSVADTMFKYVAPAFAVQVLLVIPCTFGFFWASILWRIQQIVVLALFAWTLRTRPLKQSEDDFPVLPPSMQLWWPSADVHVEKHASGSDDSVTTPPVPRGA